MSRLLRRIGGLFGSQPGSRRRLHHPTSLAAEVGLLEERLLLTIGADGWTVLAPSSDSRIVYVSSSSGNDGNTGLSSASPLKTVGAGMGKLRAGMPDWLVLKSGDTFTGVELGFGVRGRSADEPIVISSYGTGARPVLSQANFTAWMPGSAVEHIAIRDLAFQGNFVENPSDANLRAFLLAGNVSNVLFEGCSFTGYHVGIQIREVTGNLSFRRNVIADNGKQGLLLEVASNVLLEENVFDHNGWDGGATVFNHNAYLFEVNNLTVRNNIFARGSNFGTKLSSDTPGKFTNFVVENNLYFDNGISLDHSEVGTQPGTYTHNQGTIRDNIFTEIGRTFVTGNKQDLGAWLLNSRDVEWSSNLFVHKAPLVNDLIMRWEDHHANITMKDNVVYDWNTAGANTLGGVTGPGNVTGWTYTNNAINLPAATYSDPTRSVGSYYASIGGSNNALAFVTAARTLSKSTWNAAYTADAVNDYIRDGFSTIVSTLSVTLNTTSISESAGSNAATGTVTRSNASLIAPLVVTLSSNDVSEATVPVSVTIPAGQSSVTFSITAVDDTLVDGTQIVTLTASAAGYVSGTKTLDVTDNELSLPVLTSPAAQVNSLRPVISWVASPGATSYEIWIRNQSTNTNPFHTGTATGTSYTPDVDLGIGTFNLWVRARGTLGDSPWTAQFNFVINTTASLSEIDRWQPTSRPTISWPALPGAAKYDVWISDQLAAVSPYLRDQNVTGTSFTPSTDLPVGLYRTWVRGIAADGVAGGWSLMKEFYVATMPVLTLTAPSTFDRTPDFSWNAVSGALTYQVFVRNQTTGATIYNPLNVNGTTWTPPIDLPDGPYRWWIRANGAYGVVGLWSAPGDINVAGIAAVLAPTGTITNSTPAFVWQQVGDAARYELWVTNMTTNVRVIFLTNLTTTSYTSASSLTNGAYRVWVRAVSSSGESTAWSVPVNFTIAYSESPGEDTLRDNNPGLADLLVENPLLVTGRFAETTHHSAEKSDAPKFIERWQQNEHNSAAGAKPLQTATRRLRWMEDGGDADNPQTELEQLWEGSEVLFAELNVASNTGSRRPGLQIS